jgi:hypothetical protein
MLVSDTPRFHPLLRTFSVLLLVVLLVSTMPPVTHSLLVVQASSKTSHDGPTADMLLAPIQQAPYGPFPSDIPAPTLDWLSVEANNATSTAWGDYDGDGDLDLAVGNDQNPLRIYENRAGVLTDTAFWSSPTENDKTKSVAWGDYDNDGDLDLVVGIYGAENKLYRNDDTSNGRKFILVPWNLSETNTNAIAWGDCNGDGFLDLAIGNESNNLIYVNQGGAFLSDAIWSTTETLPTTSIAWGDYDSDGNLDLVVGNTTLQGNQVYRNKGDCTFDLVWTSSEEDNTQSVAWGDMNGDGKIDHLAVGNKASNGNAVRLYATSLVSGTGEVTLTHEAVWSHGDMNTMGVTWGDYDGDGRPELAMANDGAPNSIYKFAGGENPVPIGSWSSEEESKTQSVAWGDYDNDGDLDLAFGNNEQPNQIYRNNMTPFQPDPGWTSALTETTYSIAWGDYDGDGDLDLVSGNKTENRIYRNDGGILKPDQTFGTGQTRSLAWGDCDGDGDLDLAAAEGSHIYWYRNNAGNLTGEKITVYSYERRSVAWGDYDSDGDLDLAVGSIGTPNEVYGNDGQCGFTLNWEAKADDSTTSVAWGDIDNDGDLDLAVGNGGNNPKPNRVYRNDAGTLSTDPAWSSVEAHKTSSIAWGDYDGDGDLDLAVGNDGQPNQLYRNDDGVLSEKAVWSSVETDKTTSIAWGDMDNDGDLDLAVGNDGQSDKIYRNDNGVLSKTASWEAAHETRKTTAIAWGDYDNDGDLDLTTANEDGSSDDSVMLYDNTRNHFSTQTAIPYIILDSTSSALSKANFYATSHVQQDPTIEINYTLVHTLSASVHKVLGYYSLDGGGNWKPAVATNDTQTTDLSSAPGGKKYTFIWDVFKSGVMGQSDNVVFRLVAIPTVKGQENRTAGPYQYGATATQSFPFRVRGTQVQVLRDGQAVKGAKVYRLKATDNPDNGLPFADATGKPFQTNKQGFLQGRGEIQEGDRLVALLLQNVAWEKGTCDTDTCSLYLTSAKPTVEGLQATEVKPSGTQKLDIETEGYPLLLLNLDISLEWHARTDERFMSQLRYDLRRTSEILYDWSNGQVALGNIQIYHNRERWNEAHMRIYATNRLQPTANQGGIAQDELTETVTHPDPDTKTTITYAAGQIRMGSVWNRYGEAQGEIGEDWPRTLAHEIGHYALFLNDNYLGMSEDGNLIQVKTCKGAMVDPFLDEYSEFHPAGNDWKTNCARTLSNIDTGRSDWETITTFYPWLKGPEADAFDEILNTGPRTLPLRVTTLQEMVEGLPPSDVLDVTIFLIIPAGADAATATDDDPEEDHETDSGVRAFLFQYNELDSQGNPKDYTYLVDLGRPVNDQINARGARPQDRLCVFDLFLRQQKCEVIVDGDQHLEMGEKPDWKPEIIVTPETSKTFKITVPRASTGILQAEKLELMVRIYPQDDPPSTQKEFSLNNGMYEATIELDQPSLEGYVHIWVDESEPRRESITDYVLGGNPGRRWGSGRRSGSGRRRGRRAPVTSADGNVIISGNNLEFDIGEFYTLQAAATIPSPPEWATPMGQAYYLAATERAPTLEDTSLRFEYIGNEVPPGEEEWLRIYFYREKKDGKMVWEQLPTSLDTYYNTASAQVQGPGLYALMTSIEISLVEGWNLKAYTINQNRSVENGLRSIEGKYATIYDYQEGETAMDKLWKQYSPDVEEYANTLTTLEFGQGYWISATETITWYNRGATAPAVALNDIGDEATMPPLPPATFYGEVISANAFTPTVGMNVEAYIDGILCGKGETMTKTTQEGEQVVYVINVLSDNVESKDSVCGRTGRIVQFRVDGREMEQTHPWSNGQFQKLNLVASPYRLYMPVIKK